MKIDIDGNVEYIDGYNEEIDISGYTIFLSFYFPLYLFLPVNSTLLKCNDVGPLVYTAAFWPGNNIIMNNQRYYNHYYFFNTSSSNTVFSII